MSKTPYTRVSSKEAEGIAASKESAASHTCGTEYSEIVGANNPSIRLAMENLNRNYRNTVNPEDCVDGGCDTVYIPFIITFSEYQGDNVNVVGSAFQLGGGAARTSKYRECVDGMQKYNLAMAGGLPLGSVPGDRDYISINTLIGGQINEYTWTENYAMQGNKKHFNLLSNIRYYTGAQIYNEELDEFEDEFVSHREIYELFPNIQFYLPHRIKTSHIINNFYLPSTGCQVNLLDVINYLGLPENSLTRQLLNQEYLHFASDYPGLYVEDSKDLNQTFYTKLNVLQQIINGNTLSLDVPFKKVGQQGDWNKPEMEGESWWKIMNHQGFKNLGFSYFAMGFSGSSYVRGDTWSTFMTPYSPTGVQIQGGNSLPPRFLLHEFGHTMGRTHAWTVPVVSGSWALESFGITYDQNGNITQTSSFPGGGIMYSEHMPAGTSILDKKILNFDLKPPFAYNSKNLLYKNIKRDSDKADEDYNYWSNLPLDRFAGNNRSLSEIIEKYAERKTLLNNRLASTSEIKVGDFMELSEDEKGYVEFVYNRFLPHYTRDFGVKMKFVNGTNSEGGSKVQALYPGNSGRLLSDIANGISSFWGGSYILKNPPEFGSIYKDGVVLNGRPGRKPIEQRYTYIVKVLELAATWDQAQAIPEEDGFFLPDAELLSELVYNGSSSAGAQNIGDDTDFHTNLYGNHANVGTLNVKVWTTTSVSGTTARSVSLSRNPSTSSSPTTGGKNNLFTVIHIKQVDLLEDNTIATQLVVNPTNDDGTRKGPDVTTRIPFCLYSRQYYTVASEHYLAPSTDISLNTYYDPYWIANFNAYNPKFPAYPDNTPVDNLLDPEFCPCLHNIQTYYNGDGNTYEFKIIGGGDNAWAAHAMMVGNFCKDEINKFERHSNYNNPLGIQNSNPNNVTFSRMSELAGVWLLYTTNRYKDGYDSPNLFTKGDVTSVALHTYDDPDQTVLTLPLFSGYCGFGWGTVLPLVYNVDRQKIAKYKHEYEPYIPSGTESAKEVPTEFNISSTAYSWETELRLGYAKGSSHGGNATTANNMEQRYGIGQTSSGSHLYNPLAKFKSQTVSYTQFKDVEGSSYDITAFDTEPKLEYYEDFYGTYDPFNLNDIMMYDSIDSTTGVTTMPRDWVKRINYHFNRNDVDLLENYKTIISEDDPTATGYNSYTSDFQVIIEGIASLVKNFDIQSQVGGCDDPEAYNYNELATYNDGTCVEEIYGCNQSWAENYLIDSDGSYNPDINTDDGSCYATICNNPLAQGEYGAGYNQGLINNILEYSEQYDIQALIAAADNLVDQLDETNYTNCQFTNIPRNTIIRTVCLKRDELENLNVCNDNPIITYIRDKDTGDFYNYTSNPQVVQTPLHDLLYISQEEGRTFDNGINKLLLSNIYNIHQHTDTFHQSYNHFTYNYHGGLRTVNDLPFPSRIEGETLDPDTNANRGYHVLVFGDSILEHYNSAHSWNTYERPKYKNAIYNCIENPILPDGTGGCMLYTPVNSSNNNDLDVKFSACTIAEVETVTPFNCDNQIVFSPEETGGYIVDVSFLNSGEEVQTLNPCNNSLNPEPKYIIGGDLSASYGEIAKQNGIEVSYSSLPKYSGSQISEISGYPVDILDPNLMPAASRNTPNRSISRYSANETIVTSSVLYTSISEYFYTVDGNSYSGSYVVKYNTATGEIYYEIHAGTQGASQSMNRLYTRVQVLKLNPDLKPTYEETLSKKMHKVINKIINLPIFTDN